MFCFNFVIILYLKDIIIATLKNFINKAFLVFFLNKNLRKKLSFLSNKNSFSLPKVQCNIGKVLIKFKVRSFENV